MLRSTSLVKESNKPICNIRFSRLDLDWEACRRKGCCKILLRKGICPSKSSSGIQSMLVSDRKPVLSEGIGGLYLNMEDLRL